MSRLFDDANTEQRTSAQAVATDEPLSFAAWIYPDAVGINQAICCLDNSAATQHYQLLYVTNGNVLKAASRDAGAGVVSSGVAIGGLNTWSHTAGVFAAGGASRIAYIDGTPDTIESTVRNPVGINRISIGNWPLNSTYFSGRIAELAVWTAALTQANVTMLASGASPLMVQSANLVIYYPGLVDDTEMMQGLTWTGNAPDAAAHPPTIFYPNGGSGSVSSAQRCKCGVRV